MMKVIFYRTFGVNIKVFIKETAVEWAGRITGLVDQNVEVAMMVTPDGHSRLELSQFIMAPSV